MDWNQPGLNSAVDYLINRYLDRAADRLDLDGVLVVVPGSRAGRRLSQLLSRKAAELEVALFLPIIQTVGHLPEHLYHPKRPFASELVQQLAWIEAIQKEKSRFLRFQQSNVLQCNATYVMYLNSYQAFLIYMQDI